MVSAVLADVFGLSVVADNGMNRIMCMKKNFTSSMLPNLLLGGAEIRNLQSLIMLGENGKG